MFRSVILLSCWAWAAWPVSAADSPAVAQGVRVATYSGWENALVLAGGDAQAVVVPATGGRIAQFALNGDNVLYEEPGSGGKTLANTPAGFAVGGYQCDLGPELRRIPDHKLLWMGAWQWTAPRPHTVSLQSQPDFGIGVQLEKEIMVAPDSGELGLLQRMKNVSSKEVAFCLWDRTVCKGGGFAFFPLNKKSRFKAGWSIRKEGSGPPTYDGGKPSDPRVRVLGGVLVAETKGPLLRLGADSDAGWIAYAVGRLLFVKHFPVFPSGNYAGAGHSVEFACDGNMASLEPLSPEVNLKPGESYTFPEKWTLLDLNKPVGSFSAARALGKRVPVSPFKK